MTPDKTVQSNDKTYLTLYQCRTEINNLVDILYITSSLTNEIEVIHKKNCLCLCVKPQTVYKKHGSNEVRLQNRRYYPKVTTRTGASLPLSIHDAWSAPELKHKRVEEICEATDIYSIGAVMFWLVTNQVPTLSDVIFGGKLNSNEDMSICKDLDDVTELLLRGILVRCLNNSVKSRYQGTEKLLSDLLLLMSSLAPL